MNSHILQETVKLKFSFSRGIDRAIYQNRTLYVNLNAISNII